MHCFLHTLFAFYLSFKHIRLMQNGLRADRLCDAFLLSHSNVYFSSLLVQNEQISGEHICAS